MHHKLIGTLVLALAVGGGSFMATLAATGERDGGETADSRPALQKWLALSPEQTQSVEAADRGFADDLTTLNTRLRDEREKLATLFDDPDSDEAAVLAQVDKAVDVQRALERRVARHVFAIRAELTEPQRKQLLGMTASGLRRENQRRHRYGWGRGGAGDESATDTKPSRGQGRGRGGRWGRGGRGGD